MISLLVSLLPHLRIQAPHRIRNLISEHSNKNYSMAKPSHPMNLSLLRIAQCKSTLYKYIKSSHFHITITVIGCGGTGSHFVLLLARMVHAYRSLYRNRDISVILCDGDLVSPTNVSRQAFVTTEIGLNKAEALVTRYNHMYGFEWQAYTDYVNHARLNDISANIIVTCVDKLQPRRIINGLMKSAIKTDYGNDSRWQEPMLWIDTGNTRNTSNIFASVPGDKTIIDHYPNLKEDDTMPSCSTAEALLNQSLFINTITADIAAMMLWDLLYLYKIPANTTFINLERLSIKQSHEDNNSEWPHRQLTTAS